VKPIHRCGELPDPEQVCFARFAGRSPPRATAEYMVLGARSAPTPALHETTPNQSERRDGRDKQNALAQPPAVGPMASHGALSLVTEGVSSATQERLHLLARGRANPRLRHAAAKCGPSSYPDIGNIRATAWRASEVHSLPSVLSPPRRGSGGVSAHHQSRAPTTGVRTPLLLLDRQSGQKAPDETCLSSEFRRRRSRYREIQELASTPVPWPARGPW
jgi:hypothetical protein